MEEGRTLSEPVRGLDRIDLLAGFQRLGVSRGDLLAVHSSLSAFGHVNGGASTVVEALLDAVGPSGTILMPCFTHPLPEVDALSTPCRLGAIPERFRVHPAVHLSNNHTHRVAAVGPKAAHLVACHEGTSPLGRGSPFHELARLGGSVLFLGCDFTSCSLIHVAEALIPQLPYLSAQIAYPGYGISVSLTRTDGAVQVCPPRDNPGDSSSFGVVEAAMESRGLLRSGTVGSARCIFARGNDILATAIDLLAEDPLALLCRQLSCAVCAAKRTAAAGSACSSGVFQAHP
jgi:aminoglycoside 3-N-acetyltransferase